MKDFIVFDSHCDTITKLMEHQENLYQNNRHFDIEHTKKYKGYIQVFAAWIDAEKFSFNPLQRSLQIIDEFYEQIEKSKQSIRFVKNIEEAMEVVHNNKVAAFLSIEGGEALQGDLSVLRMLYKLGVRSICLTWNGRNEIADGVGEECTNGGLTRFGKQVVREMNKLKMLIDVSHLSPKGFWDVIECSSQPIIASHSNAKTICNHPRNLDDEQFKAIIKKEGVAGINLCPSFLNHSGKAGLKDIINHIEHFMSLGGENHIGIGADFDGIDSTPEYIKGIEDLEQVFEALLCLNYTETQVKKIANENFIRVFEQVLTDK